MLTWQDPTSCRHADNVRPVWNGSAVVLVCTACGETQTLGGL